MESWLGYCSRGSPFSFDRSFDQQAEAVFCKLSQLEHSQENVDNEFDGEVLAFFVGYQQCECPGAGSHSTTNTVNSSIGDENVLRPAQ